MKTHYKIISYSAVLSSLLILSGCHSNDNVSSGGNTNDNKRSYTVSVSNLTGNQPLSPVGLVLDKEGFKAWMTGQTANEALEQLAEGGDASALVSQASALASNLATTTGTGAIASGMSQQFTLSATGASSAKLTVFSMLINTNDAFTGVNAVSLDALTVDQELVFDVPAYDAGTELNSEEAGTMPGPADGGEGFNAARDDLLDKVTIHQGVISQDDGLASSTLDQSHRFDNPVARVTITRTE